MSACQMDDSQWCIPGTCKYCDAGREPMKKIKLDTSDPETRAIFEAAKSAKKEVDSWPEWKSGLPSKGTSKETSMRRFVLNRVEDFSGTSGTGIVAEGVEFSNGSVSIHWISQLESVAVYANAKVLEKLHGHDGRTKIEWLDP